MKSKKKNIASKVFACSCCSCPPHCARFAHGGSHICMHVLVQSCSLIVCVRCVMKNDVIWCHQRVVLIMTIYLINNIRETPAQKVSVTFMLTSQDVMWCHVPDYTIRMGHLLARVPTVYVRRSPLEWDVCTYVRVRQTSSLCVTLQKVRIKCTCTDGEKRQAHVTSA